MVNSSRLQRSQYLYIPEIRCCAGHLLSLFQTVCGRSPARVFFLIDRHLAWPPPKKSTEGHSTAAYVNVCPLVWIHGYETSNLCQRNNLFGVLVQYWRGSPSKNSSTELSHGRFDDFLNGLTCYNEPNYIGHGESNPDFRWILICKGSMVPSLSTRAAQGTTQSLCRLLTVGSRVLKRRRLEVMYTGRTGRGAGE